MTPNYGYGAIDWAAVANDPFWKYYQQNNLGFRSTQPSQNQAEQAYLKAMQEAAAQDTTKAQNIVPDYKDMQPESSGLSGWITGGLGAAALLTGAAAIKGHGNIFKGFKLMGEFITGKAGKLKSKVVNQNQGKLENLVALRNADGTYSYLVPGETVTFKKADINTPEKLQEIANKYGIDLKELLAFKQGNSTLKSGVFKYKDKNDKVFEITFENNKITKIKDHKDDVTSLWLAKDANLNTKDKEFLAELEDFISNAQKMEKGWAKNFVSCDITRTLGDNIAKISYQKGTKPVVTSLTTLEHLGQDNKAVRAWLQNHEAEKELFTNKTFLEKGIIPEGAKVEYAEIPYKGKICRFENGKFRGIQEVGTNGKYYAKGSKDCDSFLLDEETNITKLYENFLKGNLPKGTNKSEIKLKLSA